MNLWNQAHILLFYRLALRMWEKKIWRKSIMSSKGFKACINRWEPDGKACPVPKMEQDTKWISNQGKWCWSCVPEISSIGRMEMKLQCWTLTLNNSKVTLFSKGGGCAEFWENMEQLKTIPASPTMPLSCTILIINNSAWSSPTTIQLINSCSIPHSDFVFSLQPSCTLYFV